VSLNGQGLRYWRLKLRAVTWLLLGRSEAAEREFTAILAHWPGDAYALASRAHVRSQLRRRTEAIEDARALVAAHPRRSAADWFNLAFLLEDAGELAPAEQAFREALSLDPKLDRAWYGLGLTLIRQQRFDEAAAALRRNTELQPMSPYGWYQLARVHMDRHEPEETRRIIRHLKGFEPKVAAQLERETGLVP
jgi:tetratricopeptide (TPR) repeat protein